MRVFEGWSVESGSKNLVFAGKSFQFSATSGRIRPYLSTLCKGQRIAVLEVRLIGKFDIRCDSKQVTLSSRVAQSLFAYLILKAGIPHRREKLAGMFWPDQSEKKARAYLRYELWRIRKALDSQSRSDYLSVDDINICFNPLTNYWVDVSELEKVSQSTSVEELMAALANCHGEFLPGFYDEWITQEREHLQAVHEQKITWLLESLEKEKRWKDILEWAESWITLGHGPETAYRYLMIAYDALGDHAKVASTYQRCVQALREVDLEPSEQTRTLAFQRNSKLNIPIPLTSFIGREKELSEVDDLLTKCRLVTLTGSGGVGKTRLAIQVMADVLERFPDGVWFLDLAPLGDPALVPNTLANLIGLRESSDTKLSFTDLLINYFRSYTALVIFDNCEHLIETSAQLVYLLLTSCEGLSILATSREALRVSGEMTYRVPSLEIPQSDLEFTIDEISNIESVRLFTERTAVATPRFVLNSQNAPAIVKICQRLDGIPLAIELAAARVNMLTVDQILKRLDDRFKILIGGLRTSLPRHQTLHATMEWSYDLLSEKERLLFRRLAVFMGGWRLEAAEEVCRGHGIELGDVLDLLSQLVNKSLVLVETLDIETRYRSLETIRQFSYDKLIETKEAMQLRDRHLVYFLMKAEEIEPDLGGAQHLAGLDYIEKELDNIRIALDWSISNKKSNEAFRLFGALGHFWLIRCHFQEAVQWFKRTMALREGVAKNLQANVLAIGASLHWIHESTSAARTLLRESINISRELGDMKGLADRLLGLGVVELSDGNFAEAHTLFKETLTVSRMANNRAATTRALFNLADISCRERDYLTAARQYEESLVICRQLNDDHLTTMVLLNIGDFVLQQRDYAKAHEFYEEALRISLNLKSKRVVAFSLLGFADILCARSSYRKSAALQGFAVRMLDELEAKVIEQDLASFPRTVNTLKFHMGEDSYNKEYGIGKNLTLEQAIEIALPSQ